VKKLYGTKQLFPLYYAEGVINAPPQV